MEKKERPATTRDSDKYIVRLPEGMRDRLHEQARANSRTLNAEIVARLQASFDGSELPEAFRKGVETFAELAKCSFEEAFDAVMLAVTSPWTKEVLIIYPQAGMSAQDYLTMFQEARKHVAPDASILLDHTRKKPVRPSKMIAPIGLAIGPERAAAAKPVRKKS